MDWLHTGIYICKALLVIGFCISASEYIYKYRLLKERKRAGNNYYDDRKYQEARRAKTKIYFSVFFIMGAVLLAAWLIDGK